MKKVINNTLAFLVGLLIALVLMVPLDANAENCPVINYDYTSPGGSCLGNGVSPSDLGYNEVCDETKINQLVYISSGGAGTCGENFTYYIKRYCAWGECPVCENHYTWGTFVPTGEYGCIEDACTNQLVSDDICETTIDCVNGIQDDHEDGIDCGGTSCTANCVAYCPDGWSNVLDQFCAAPAVPADSFDNCPDGTTAYSSSEGCQKTTPIVWAASSVPPEDLDIIDPDYGWSDVPTPVQRDDVTTIEEVDNGDGTSTETITTTTTITNSDNSTTTNTTVITNVIDNSTGEVVGTTSTSDAVGDVSGTDLDGLGDMIGDPADYDWTLPDGEGMSDLSEFEPEEKDIGGLFRNFIDNNPLTSVFAGTAIETTSPVCKLEYNYKGTIVEFSLCGEPYYSTFIWMGNFLVFICTITGYFIIFGRK